MRTRWLVPLTCLLATACATLPPEQAERNAMVIKAARICQLTHPAIVVTGVDPYGRLRAESRSQAEWASFRACHQTEVRRLVGSTDLGAGRLLVPPTGASPSTVPMEVAGSAMLVSAMIDGTHPVTLLLDTGASLTIVRPRALTAAGVDVSRRAPRVVGTVVGGRTVDMPYVRLRSLSVGGLTVESIDVAAYDAAPQSRHVDGLLGANFLNHFKVTIDRGAGLLTLTPPAAK